MIKISEAQNKGELTPKANKVMKQIVAEMKLIKVFKPM
jgi:hypothetical protein